MNIKEIQNLIKFISKSGVDEVTIEKDDFKITIKSSGEVNKSYSKQEIINQITPNDNLEGKTADVLIETSNQEIPKEENEKHTVE